MVEEYWDQPKVIVEQITAENAKEVDRLQGKLPIHVMMRTDYYRSRVFSNGHLQIVKKLLKLYPKGAKRKNHRNLLPINFITESTNNSESWIEAVKLTLEAYPKALYVKDAYEKLAIRGNWVCQYLSEYLVEDFPEWIRMEDRKGRLPIHYVSNTSEDSSASLIQAVKLMLEAYPEALFVQDFKGGLPLRSAWVFEHLTKYLIKKFNKWITTMDGKGLLPMHHTVLFNNVKATKLCHNKFPGGLKSKTEDGNQPIYLMCFPCCYRGIQSLSRYRIMMEI